MGGELNLPDPRLTEVSTGEALRALNSGFIALKAGGEVVKGKVELAPRIVMVNGTSATLTDCYTNRLFRFRADTGEPSGTTDPTTRLVNVRMVLEGGSWKVKTIGHESDGCVPDSH